MSNTKDKTTFEIRGGADVVLTHAVEGEDEGVVRSYDVVKFDPSGMVVCKDLDDGKIDAYPRERVEGVHSEP